MKYKIGDRVKVRNDLKIGKYYGNDTFEDTMIDYLGKKVVITEIKNMYFYEYLIENCMYGQTEEMFEN